MNGISCVSGTVQGRLRSLERMVRSVRESIGEGIPYEIILVACSCDEVTHEWIRTQPNCRLFTMEAQGAVPAFNRGFGEAVYDYVVTLNDDIIVRGNTIHRAYEYMRRNPRVGQVAFAHLYQNRKVDPNKPVVQRVYGYPYAQCGMTRKWLGERAKWWGDYGLVQYGGDNHLSCEIWRMGYQVVPLSGCAVVDWEIEDATRQRFSHQMRKEGGGVHPDTRKFGEVWRGRLPKPHRWIPAKVNRILVKAAQGNLRTIRFKAMMGSGTKYRPRTALIDTFRRYGPAQQSNQSWAVSKYGGVRQVQPWFVKTVEKYQPDLIMLQGQRPNNILPPTVALLRKAAPHAFIFNFDADTHYPMLEWHAEIAKVCDLQLTVSPDLFAWYGKRGAWNIGYWPIGVERDFLEVDRYEHFEEDKSLDVLFLGSLYGEDHFPEAINRGKAVKALYNAKGIRCRTFGNGWHKVGIDAESTLEDFVGNPVRYSRSKMALSISQTTELWGYTSDRLYNIVATGCPALVQRFNGMDEHGFVDGKTCIAWTTFKEMVEKARFYKAHSREREEVGRAGREMLLKRHTWDVRVGELFHLIAGLGE